MERSVEAEIDESEKADGAWNSVDTVTEQVDVTRGDDYIYFLLNMYFVISINKFIVFNCRRRWRFGSRASCWRWFSRSLAFSAQ